MLNLYTETAFQIKPSTPASLKQIELPSKYLSDRKSRPSSSSSTSISRAFAKDEKSFSNQYLASQGSIYCRQTKAYPRTFLWRVLDGGYTLQIQCADLARSAADQKEAHLTLSLEFHHAIIPSGVAFSDAEKGDVLFVSVITSRKELYTLSLHTDFFRSFAYDPKQIVQWCHSEVPSSFTIDQPHLLYAKSPFELYVSFESGRLQKLSRRAEDYNWIQENYDDKTWGASIRGIVSRRGPKAIEYGSRYVDPTTVHAVVASSEYVFTSCLNHTLRVWNLTTGKLVVSKDLLDKARQPQDHIQMNPTEPGYIRLLKLEHLNHPILVTYSPLDGGQLKFWDVKGGLTSPLLVEDKYPGIKLNPPDPDPSGNTVWSLTGLEIRPGDNSKRSELWVLWRNNNYHQLYSLDFDFFDLEDSWEANWIRTEIAPSIKHAAPDLVKSDPQDVTSRWLEFLFHPGRYPASVLETALYIYQDALSTRSTASQRTKSLQERLCVLIAANVTLRKYAESDMDYDRFVADTDYQWRNFWRIVETINEGRQAPIALALDVFADMTWIMMADYCCAIRECSLTELLQFNDSDSLKSLEGQVAERWRHRKISANDGEPLHQQSALIKAAATFANSFSAELMRDVEAAIEEELLVEQENPVPFRLNDFYERVNFGDLITNETYDQVQQDISKIGGMARLSNELFFAILSGLPDSAEKPKSALRSTIFASSLLSAGLQDTISATRQLLIDLLVLLVFLDGEMDQEETHSMEFDASELFQDLLGALKEYEKDLWLVSHSRLVPLEFLGPNPAPNTLRSSDRVSWENGRYVTILEDSIGKAVRPQPVVDKPQLYMLTDMLGEIEAWIGGKDEISPEDGIVYIQCDLIAQGNLDLARDFQRFQPNTAWATYVKARLCLARGEYTLAAVHFQKASYPLACGKAVGSLDEMSAGLISMLDVDSFNNGLPRYFQHVMSLFDSAKAYSQAAYSARLALQSLSPDQQEPVPHFKSEVLSRLFTAELKCSNLKEAYDALIQFSDIALQRSSLISMVTALLDPKSSLTGSVGALQLLQTLPLALHPHLLRHLDQHLSAQAKKQSATPDTLTQWTAGSNVDYLKILHALRVGQHDYRGAVTVLFDRLRLIRKSNRARGDPEATGLRHALLALINALSCVAPDEAYILTEAEEAPRANGMSPDHETAENTGRRKRKRIIVTLDDLRKEYQQVLDRCSRIERGDFDFDMDGDSDEDEEEQEVARPRLNGVTHSDAMQM